MNVTDISNEEVKWCYSYFRIVTIEEQIFVYEITIIVTIIYFYHPYLEYYCCSITFVSHFLILHIGNLGP